MQGGLSSDISQLNKTFISAYVTDTRLMGVLAVYARWAVGEDSSVPELHQFFYIDCEEAGLETYRSFRGDFGPEAAMAEQSLVGGLGAGKVPLSEKELKCLLTCWMYFNRKRELPLPPGFAQYSFVFNRRPPTSKQLAALMGKICCPITEDYQVVNYFLMRCFGRDYGAAAFLTDSHSGDDGRLQEDFPLDIYDGYVKATFCRNVIDLDRRFSDGAVSYLCESLVEMEGKYDILVSKVVVRNLKVIGFEHCSGYSISSVEAAMILKKPELTNVFEINLSSEEIDDNLGEFTVGLNTVMTRHSNGRMFMAFKKTNDHVNERVFLLSNDVRGVYYLTDYGQLIVMAYNENDLRMLTSRLAASPLAPYLLYSSGYEFLEPVLFEFVNSGFEDFDDFVEMNTE
ncbi:MAG: hypothetical protein ACI4KL_00630 [Lentihominibacter sp.]